MPLFGLLPLAAAHLQLAASKALGIPEARVPSTVTEMLLGFVGLLLRPLAWHRNKSPSIEGRSVTQPRRRVAARRPSSKQSKGKLGIEGRGTIDGISGQG